MTAATHPGDCTVATTVTISGTTRMSAIGASPYARARRGVIVGYAVWCVLSVIWAFSAGLGGGRGLGAAVTLGNTAEGSIILNLRNDGRTDWTDVKVTVDGRFFVRVPTFEARTQQHPQMRELRNAYALPRPLDLFFWESTGAAQPPSDTAPATHRPGQVVIECAEGRAERAPEP